MIKKTLVARYYIDASEMDDAVIDAYKTLLRHGAKGMDIVEKVDFEVLYSNEQSTVDRMLQSVRSEFLKNDTPSENEAEVAEAEKSDGLMGFLRLLRSEDAEENEETDEAENEDDEEGGSIIEALFQGLFNRIIGNDEEGKDSDEH